TTPLTISNISSETMQDLQLAVKDVRSELSTEQTSSPSLHPKKESNLSHMFETALAKMEPVQIQHTAKITNTKALTPLFQPDLGPPSQTSIKSTHSKLPTLNRMNTYLYADDFDVEITSILNEKESGYIFAIT